MVPAIAIGAAGAGLTAYSQYKSGQFNKAMYDRAATDAERRGTVQSDIIATRGGQTAGTGLAAASAAGVDVQSGSVTDVVSGTRLMSALDAATTRSNALREAYGDRVHGAIAEAEGTNGAIGTILGGVAKAGAAAYSGGLTGSSAAKAEAYDPETFPTFVNGD